MEAKLPTAALPELPELAVLTVALLVLDFILSYVTKGRLVRLLAAGPSWKLLGAGAVGPRRPRNRDRCPLRWAWRIIVTPTGLRETAGES